jgi:hypothetical protein
MTSIKPKKNLSLSLQIEYIDLNILPLFGLYGINDTLTEVSVISPVNIDKLNSELPNINKYFRTSGIGHLSKNIQTNQQAISLLKHLLNQAHIPYELEKQSSRRVLRLLTVNNMLEAYRSLKTSLQSAITPLGPDNSIPPTKHEWENVSKFLLSQPTMAYKSLEHFSNGYNANIEAWMNIMWKHNTACQYQSDSTYSINTIHSTDGKKWSLTIPIHHRNDIFNNCALRFTNKLRFNKISHHSICDYPVDLPEFKYTLSDETHLFSNLNIPTLLLSFSRIYLVFDLLSPPVLPIKYKYSTIVTDTPVSVRNKAHKRSDNFMKINFSPHMNYSQTIITDTDFRFEEIGIHTIEIIEGKVKIDFRNSFGLTDEEENEDVDVSTHPFSTNAQLQLDPYRQTGDRFSFVIARDNNHNVDVILYKKSTDLLKFRHTFIPGQCRPCTNTEKEEIVVYPTLIKDLIGKPKSEAYDYVSQNNLSDVSVQYSTDGKGRRNMCNVVSADPKDLCLGIRKSQYESEDMIESAALGCNHGVTPEILIKLKNDLLTNILEQDIRKCNIVEFKCDSGSLNIGCPTNEINNRHQVKAKKGLWKATHIREGRETIKLITFHQGITETNFETIATDQAGEYPPLGVFDISLPIKDDYSGKDADKYTDWRTILNQEEKEVGVTVNHCNGSYSISTSKNHNQKVNAIIIEKTDL